MHIVFDGDFANEIDVYRLRNHDKVQKRSAQVPASSAVVMLVERLRGILLRSRPVAGRWALMVAVTAARPMMSV
ncbi:MAG TPA: hypothetical protein VMP01_03345 [Pirellulaceae bacterium]|nr:hypothetical protein [Pirellulaceae bacterium]